MKARALERGDRVFVRPPFDAFASTVATVLATHGSDANLDFGRSKTRWMYTAYLRRIPEREPPRVMWVALYTDDDGTEREGQAWPRSVAIPWQTRFSRFVRTRAVAGRGVSGTTGLLLAATPPPARPPWKQPTRRRVSVAGD